MHNIQRQDRIYTSGEYLIVNCRAVKIANVFKVFCSGNKIIVMVADPGSSNEGLMVEFYSAEDAMFSFDKLFPES